VTDELELMGTSSLVGDESIDFVDTVSGIHAPSVSLPFRDDKFSAVMLAELHGRGRHFDGALCVGAWIIE
jgi:hypothetical protein